MFLFSRFHISRSLLTTGLFLAGCFAVRVAFAAPFDCVHNHCGLLTQGNNPDLVVGTVDAVANASQMKTVFRWARTHGYWKSLPADGHGYLPFVQLVSVSVPAASGTRSVSVLMTRKEFKSGPLKPGALVRYSPHDAAHDAISYKDPAKEAYWKLVGCVAQLCAPGDTGCIRRYRPGKFDRHSGVQLSLDGHRPALNGVAVNTTTLLPTVSHK